jgi:glycosyltransferase involved in cell wall biosynthesis
MLAICIPTYNRAAILQRNLSRIIPQAQANNCPIYISDNASLDNTEQVVKRAKGQYNDIYYVKQTENMGFCRNFEYVLNMADADYAWLLGDDDYIRDGCIEKVLKDLKLYKDSSMFIVNGGSALHNLRIQGIHSQVFLGKNDIMYKLGAHMSWMSCLLFNKKVVGKVQFSKYEGNAFPHLWWIFASLTKESAIYWENSWCIEPLGGGHRIADFFKVFFVDWYTAIYSVEGYELNARHKCYTDGVAYAFTWKDCIKLRAEGILNRFIWKKYKKYFQQLPRFKRYLIRFLLSVPSGLCKYGIKEYKKVK